MKKEQKTGFRRTVAALLSIVLMVALIPMNSYGKTNDKYRNIKILGISGEVCIDRDGELIPGYEQMALKSGDRLVTSEEALVSLQMDDDKFLLVEEKTDLTIEAAGGFKKGYIKINLVCGAIYNEIQNPLSENDSYEVTTPEGVMAVRGTQFRVASYDGDSIVTVFQGVVGLQHTMGDNTQVDEGAEFSEDNAGLVLLTAGLEAHLSNNGGAAPNTLQLCEADPDTLPIYFQIDSEIARTNAWRLKLNDTASRLQRNVSHLQETADRFLREAQERANYRPPEDDEEQRAFDYSVPVSTQTQTTGTGTSGTGTPATGTPATGTYVP